MDNNNPTSSADNPSQPPPQSSDQAPSPPPPHQPHKKLPNWLVTIITVVIFTIIGTGAYAAYKILTPQDAPTPTPTPTPQALAPTPTPDPTANWQTYSNNDYSIKYPPEWTTDENRTDQTHFIGEPFSDSDTSPIVVSIYKYPSTTYTLRENWQEEFAPYADIQSIQQGEHVYIFRAGTYEIGSGNSPERNQEGTKIMQSMIDTFSTNDTQPTEQVTQCTLDAKICPDGVTTVGRSGPNCEFDLCPPLQNQ